MATGESTRVIIEAFLRRADEGIAEKLQIAGRAGSRKQETGWLRDFAMPGFSGLGIKRQAGIRCTGRRWWLNRHDEQGALGLGIEPLVVHDAGLHQEK